MENNDIKTADEIKKVLTEVSKKTRGIDELMYEAIKLLPYTNSHRTLHRRYRVPMLQVINAALLAANQKLIELNVYDDENRKINNVILDEVSKEIPKEN